MQEFHSRTKSARKSKAIDNDKSKLEEEETEIISMIKIDENEILAKVSEDIETIPKLTLKNEFKTKIINGSINEKSKLYINSDEQDDFEKKNPEDKESENNNVQGNWVENIDNHHQSCFINKHGIVCYDRDIADGKLPSKEEWNTLLERVHSCVFIKNNTIDIESVKEIEATELAKMGLLNEQYELEENCLLNDKAVLSRMIYASNRYNEILSIASQKDEKRFLKKLKRRVTKKLGESVDFICPPHESATLGYNDEEKLMENISANIFSQINCVSAELQRRNINPNDAKLTMERKLNEISNRYLSEINFLDKQIIEETSKCRVLDKDYSKINNLSTQIIELIKKRKFELLQLQYPEEWLVQVIKEEKINHFLTCVQAYLEEQLITYKALALGTVARKADNIEKVAKIAHVGAKIGTQVIELAAVGMVPGIGALGFVSMAMGTGRCLMKFYKDREIILEAKKILNHCGRRVEEIVEFSKLFAKKVIESYKNIIVHFQFKSISLLSQLLVEQRIPWMLHLEHDSDRTKQDTINLLTKIVIPQEYVESLSLFDTIVRSFNMKTEEGNKLNALKLLRKSSFKSQVISGKWEYAIPKNEKDRTVTAQLECLCIDSFREIPYEDFISLFGNDNKTEYSKLSTAEVAEWKTSLKEFEEDKSKKKLPKEILNALYITPDYRRKSRTSPGAPSSGTSFMDIANDCYEQYIQMEALYNCIIKINEESSDTKSDFFTVAETMATIVPGRALTKFVASRVVEGVEFLSDNI